MTISLDTFPSLEGLPQEFVDAQVRRITAIAALIRPDDPAELECRRIDRIRARVVADYLAGYHLALICQKFGIQRGAMDRIVKAETTDAQRTERKAYVHRLKVKEWSRQNEAGKQKAFRIIATGGKRSIAAAARSAGVSEQTARNYHRLGIPPEKWRATRDHAKDNQRRDIAQTVDDFPSQRKAAEATGVSGATARRYIRRGIPVEQWAEVAARNIRDYQMEGCGQ